MTTAGDDAAAAYFEAGATFADLVANIDPSAWSGPGLGEWDLRALVGHTSRALTTVLTYLDQPADSEAITSPEDYYAIIARQPTDPEWARAARSAVERGRQAGEDLGTAPSDTVRDLVQRARTQVSHADPEALITTIGGGMRLRAYLPTRTFELVVHGLDISAATGIDATFSSQVLAHATGLAARIAVTLDQGPTVLSALTGRRPLPDNFSVTR